MINSFITNGQYFMLKLADLVTLLLNAISFFIVIVYIVIATYKYLSGVGGTRETIFSGISIALSYNLAGEVIKLIFGRSISEFATIGAIILVKAGITLLMKLEMKSDIKVKPIKKNNVEKFFNKFKKNV